MSADVFLGVPFNIASYAMLLNLISLECTYLPGQLSAVFANFHIYENHFEAMEEQISRTPKEAPEITTTGWTNIWDWTHTAVEYHDYDPHPAIKAEVAI